MKKIVGIIVSVVFLLAFGNVCSASIVPLAWFNINPVPKDELAKAPDNEKEVETACKVVLKKNKPIDIIVTIKIFNKYSGINEGVINYHADIKGGKLIEDPGVRKSGYDIKIIRSNIKECINEIADLPRSALKKINRAFKDKKK